MITLKNHPFAVETFFKSSLVLTFALPKETLAPLIPPCLELDTFNEKWAFVAVALVDTKGLRPKGFPHFFGNDFILAGYRVFVRYRNEKDKNLRGLYILKSETNKSKMSFFGNIFTHYNYTNTDIDFKKIANELTITSKKSAIQISASIHYPDVNLPNGSPFGDWKEARRFAGPLPFTFTYNSKTKQVLTIEGVRQNWKPVPVEIHKQSIGFINTKFQNAILANAFLIENIPYYWKKGQIELWKG